jgi:tight adherence protein C
MNLDLDTLHLLFVPEITVTALAAIAAFATIITIGLPFMQTDDLAPRLKAVADERELLRKKAFENIGSAPPNQRPAHVSFMRHILDVLQLEEKLASPGMKQKLAAAGLRGQAPLITFLFFRFAGPPISFVLTLIYLFGIATVSWPANEKIVAAVAAALFGYYIPDIVVSNRIQKRRASIMRAFPDALDLLLICVESGISIEAAFNRVSQEVGTQSTELAEELALTTAELSYLPNRRQAFQNMADRAGHSGVKAVAAALIQSEKYGTPLGQALRVAAQENRQTRMADAERRAAALPSKLTAPMILFFLPCLFVVIMGPAMMRVFGYIK